MSDAGMDCSRLGRRYALAGLLTAVGVLGSLAMPRRYGTLRDAPPPLLAANKRKMSHDALGAR